MKTIPLKKVFKFIFFSFLIVCIFFLYLSYKSSQAQLLIINDSSNSQRTLSFNQVDSLLNGYPNITASALPVDIWRVQYLLWEGNTQEAQKFVKTAHNVNPYVHVSDYLQGLIFDSQGNIDSAYYYSKRAFEGWPKNITHYNSYLDVLEKKRDTISLIKAFQYLDSSLKLRPKYIRRFYSSFNKIKLSFLITFFEDEDDLKYSDVIGNKYERGYVFPNNQVIRDTTLSYTFKSSSIISNQNGDEFLYKIDKDSLLFYYKRDPKKPIVKYFTKFSPSRNTLIFRNVMYEKGKFQDQFFIKK